MRKILIILMLAVAILAVAESSAQNDSIVFTNGNYMVGEIKNMKQGIMQIETDYSDSDFTIDWELIKYIKSDQIYLINLSNGDRYNGSFETDPNDPAKIIIHDKDEGDVTTNLVEIVFLKTVDQTFISRLDLLLSIGYTLTKANNNHQFSGRVNLGYLSNTVGFNAYFNTVQSFQEEKQDTSIVKISTSRVEGGGGFRFFLVKDWFALVNTDLLKSSEQQLDLRAVTKAGIGNYLVNNQQMYFVLAGGAAWNYEDYTNPDSTQINPRSSAEGFLGVEYKIFDIGDLKLTTSLYGYPSFTEAGRFRSDFLFDISYEFAFDLFFGIGFTLNYDSKPAAGSDPTDYVLQTTIGWEL